MPASASKTFTSSLSLALHHARKSPDEHLSPATRPIRRLSPPDGKCDCLFSFAADPTTPLAQGFGFPPDGALMLLLACLSARV